MSKKVVNPAKTRGYVHEKPERRPKETLHSLSDLGEAYSAPEAKQEAKSDFYNSVMAEKFVVFKGIIVESVAASEIEKLLVQAQEADDFHVQANIAGQMLRVLKSLKTNIGKKLEIEYPEYVQLKRAVQHLNDLVRAKGRYVDGVAIPVLPQGHPLLVKIAELQNTIRDIEKQAYGYLDEAIDEHKTFMADNGYDTYLAEQQELWAHKSDAPQS